MGSNLSPIWTNLKRFLISLKPRKKGHQDQNMRANPPFFKLKKIILCSNRISFKILSGKLPNKNLSIQSKSQNSNKAFKKRVQGSKKDQTSTALLKPTFKWEN